jgi:hypothetical protein
MVLRLARLVLLVAVVLPLGLSAPRATDARAFAAGAPPATPAAQTEVTAEVFGQSAGGIPLTAYWVGGGPTAVVVQGALHGGPEANTSALTYLLRDYFAAHPEEIPARLRLAFIPEANPDGIALNRRLYLSGVDPNRNWDTAEWQTDAYDSDGRFVPGLGGPRPMSEPETRQFADWVLALRPAAVVQYHSRGGFIVGARELAEPYAEASGYSLPTAGRGVGGLLPYRATGSLGRWLGDQGIGGILIELSNYTSPEFERNLAGLRAVLRLVATR